MTDPHCAHAIDGETLAAYWLGELEAAVEAPLERCADLARDEDERDEPEPRGEQAKCQNRDRVPGHVPVVELIEDQVMWQALKDIDQLRLANDFRRNSAIKQEHRN